jgi:hypothetical protein
MAICNQPRAFCTALFCAGAVVSAQISPSVRQNVEAAYKREFGLTVTEPLGIVHQPVARSNSDQAAP